MKPVVIFRSASMYRESIQAGRRGASRPRTCARPGCGRRDFPRGSCGRLRGPTSSTSSSPKLGRCRPVAMRIENLVAGNARFFQGRQNLAQQERVGDGPRDVADDDAGRFLAAGQFGQGRRADGFGQRVGQGFFRLGQRLDRPQAERPDEIGVGDFDFESRFAVIQSNRAFYLPLPNELYAVQLYWCRRPGSKVTRPAASASSLPAGWR